MKKIIFFAITFCFVGLSVSAQLFKNKKRKQELTEHTSESVYAYLRPLSEMLPLTTLKIKVNGEEKEFKLVELTKRDGSTPLVYIPSELYEKIKPELTATDEQWEKAQEDNEYAGFELTASSLEGASIFTEEQMTSIDEVERRIAETYRFQKKYVVWSLAYFKAKGYRDQNGKFLPKNNPTTTKTNNDQKNQSTSTGKTKFSKDKY